MWKKEAEESQREVTLEEGESVRIQPGSLALRWSKGAMSQEHREVASRRWKGQGDRFSTRASRNEPNPANTVILAQ